MKTVSFKNLKKSDRIKIEEKIETQVMYNQLSNECVTEFFKPFNHKSRK